ncbi:MAG TPA: hypothetical protein ENH67_15735 [Pseudoalteromonas sp.]|uniref:Uncharacterized protein n=1 Tax=marine sediment metagenome TaxID=412755 RepID=A0A0F9REA8_9ZZZZ|nr:hypothetical protein [Pseudoalteromonas sp.]HDY92875.1 hypothetical protein [Pseudoalteromonas sp.]HDZ34302.1 hypothetical protein [Pseudoalteromonas sp.]
MQLMYWVILFCFIVSAASLYFSFGSKFYDPEKVLIDMDDQVFISHLPKARLHKKYGKTIPKSFVTKIQLAGNYVTLFNHSGNAIDIWAPKDKLAKPIFEQAKKIFKNAETVEVDC